MEGEGGEKEKENKGGGTEVEEVDLC